MGDGTRPVFFRETDPGAGKAGSPVSAGPADAFHGWFRELSFDDAVCWAFGVVEGDLDDIYWRYARRELGQKIQLRLGEQNALLMSHHNSFVMIVNAALSDGKNTGPSETNVRNLAAGHATAEDAAAAINRAMSF